MISACSPTPKFDINILNRTQSFFGHTVHMCIVYLSGTEGTPLWFRTLSENFVEFRVSRLAKNALSSLVCGLLTSLVLKNLGSLLGRPYRFNSTKIRLGATLVAPNNPKTIVSKKSLIHSFQVLVCLFLKRLFSSVTWVFPNIKGTLTQIWKSPYIF